ncbi:MAG: hypothetical protein ACRBCJ_03495 [Hyphomicrobiaceae bacterium]
MKKTVLILFICLLATMPRFSHPGHAAEKLDSDMAQAGPGDQVVRVIQSPIQLRPRQPGAFKSVSVILDLNRVTSAELKMTAYDIDAVEETVMTVNGTEVNLPSEIVADMRASTVTIPLPEAVLKQGTNEFGFLFAEAVGGTSGFAILDLQIVLHRQ